LQSQSAGAGKVTGLIKVAQDYQGGGPRCSLAARPFAGAEVKPGAGATGSWRARGQHARRLLPWPPAIPQAAAHADAIERALRCRLQRQVDGQARIVGAAFDAPQYAGDAVGVASLKTQQRRKARCARWRTGRAVAPPRDAVTVKQRDRIVTSGWYWIYKSIMRQGAIDRAVASAWRRA
jgi:hypothetical protein